MPQKTNTPSPSRNFETEMETDRKVMRPPSGTANNTFHIVECSGAIRVWAWCHEQWWPSRVAFEPSFSAQGAANLGWEWIAQFNMVRTGGPGIKSRVFINSIEAEDGMVTVPVGAALKELNPTQQQLVFDIAEGMVRQRGNLDPGAVVDLAEEFYRRAMLNEPPRKLLNPLQPFPAGDVEKIEELAKEIVAALGWYEEGAYREVVDLAQEAWLRHREVKSCYPPNRTITAIYRLQLAGVSGEVSLAWSAKKQQWLGKDNKYWSAHDVKGVVIGPEE